ncbi:TetR/AcrR family transcriptional regulator [Paraliobacillus sediminis]|uniref:TetR/AcrR family transcriptional regulator n=1 Tax=Paraliobacillus sediminis TaxID=1885916 RepID=UPI000E3EE486|nr:TetR/AcrR family transcriptional regulator [Paraliobacillus sediminis]
MNEKKKRIIEESMKLFAEKGFHATSIQEIAKKSEVSKGAFYLYFHSKEELTIAIFDYYTSMVMEKVEKIHQQDKDGKTKLVEQLKMFFDLITNHKEYVIMQFRDNLQVGNKIDEMVIKLNKQGFEWIQKSVKEIYGDKADVYIVDISIQLDGIIQGYFKSIVLHNLHLDTSNLAQFVVDRLDDMIIGMVSSNAKPQITLEQLSYDFIKENKVNNESVQLLIDQLSSRINDSSLESDKKTQLREAVSVIHDELQKENKNELIVQGMLTQFYAIPSLQQISKEIADALHVSVTTIDIKKNEGDQ